MVGVLVCGDIGPLGGVVMKSLKQVKARLAKVQAELSEVHKTYGHRRKDYYYKHYYHAAGQFDALNWLLDPGEK